MSRPHRPAHPGTLVTRTSRGSLPVLAGPEPVVRAIALGHAGRVLAGTAAVDDRGSGGGVLAGPELDRVLLDERVDDRGACRVLGGAELDRVLLDERIGLG